MKLITKAIEAKLLKTPLHSTESLNTKPVIVKFFTPDSNWTWYVVEGERRSEDWEFFGLVEGLETEWGYFTLSELQSIRGSIGLPIERDKFFDGMVIGPDNKIHRAEVKGGQHVG